MNKGEYQEKYKNQLSELNMIGYYKIGAGKDTQYFKTFKISEPLDYYHQGTVTYGFFYNPNTKETACIWETDWDREGLDDFTNEVVNSIYGGDFPIEVLEDYNKQCEIALQNENLKRRKIRWEQGICSIGDTVEIVKGRKLPIGEIKVIKEITPWRDQYGRTQNWYAVFTDNTRTSISNCKLISQAPIDILEHVGE